MGVVLPDSVAVFLNVLGIPWINVDEDQVHETAGHIRTFVADLDNTLRSANDYMSALEAEYSGRGYQLLLAEWAAVDSTHMSALRTGGTTVAGVLDVAGTMIAALKAVAVAELAALFTAAGALLVSGVGATLQPVVAAAVRRIVLALKIAVEEHIFGELLELAVTEFEDVVRDVVEGIGDFAYRVAAAALDVGGTPAELRLDPAGARRYADAIAGLGDDIAEHHARLTENLAQVGDGSRSGLLDEPASSANGIGSGTTAEAPPAPEGTLLEQTRTPSGHSPLSIAAGSAAHEVPRTPGARTEDQLTREAAAAQPGPISATTPVAERTAHADTALPARSAAGAPADPSAGPMRPAADRTEPRGSAEVETSRNPAPGRLPTESPGIGAPDERIGASVPAASEPFGGATELPTRAGFPEPRNDSPGPGAGGTGGPAAATANASATPAATGMNPPSRSGRRSTAGRAADPEPTVTERTNSRPPHHSTGAVRRTPWTKGRSKSEKPAVERAPWARPATAVSAPPEIGTPPTVSIRQTGEPTTAAADESGHGDGKTMDAAVSARPPESAGSEAERRNTTRVQQ
ncbi:hypothetical protein [Nocardia sp. CA-290969]|uniref:hypothetical protein n=1 Tax=Nocardia sp. CA-290969 TaxID=3239986 RepID=UPI003D8F0CC5